MGKPLHKPATISLALGAGITLTLAAILFWSAWNNLRQSGQSEDDATPIRTEELLDPPTPSMAEPPAPAPKTSPQEAATELPLVSVHGEVGEGNGFASVKAAPSDAALLVTTVSVRLDASLNRAVVSTSQTTTTTGVKAVERAEFVQQDLTMENARLFVMAMCHDLNGNLWIGTEGGGIERFDRSAPEPRQWRRFTTRDGLGDDNGYAIACDHRGRIWVGHLNHGVSVYNGSKWQNYELVGGLSRPGTLNGPLGERVFRIAVCPVDGDVWIATNRGLARYSDQLDAWTYFTRAEGLPGEEAEAIAFDKAGNIYLGMQCHGIAIALRASGYNRWRVVQAPEEPPPSAPSGTGLPSNLINDLLVAKNGSIYAGTCAGIGYSEDAGTSWRYWRGKDWWAKAKFRAQQEGAPAPDGSANDAVLAEDYITCLAEGENGEILVGHRQRGLEIIDPSKAQTRTAPDEETGDSFISAIATAKNFSPVLGSYGFGIVSNKTAVGARGFQRKVTDHTAPANPSLPSGAKAPSDQEIQDLLIELGRAGPNSAPTKAPVLVSLPDDWGTQGAWLGRYGKYWAILGGMAGGDYIWGAAPGSPIYRVGLGPNHTQGDTVRRWIEWLATADPRCLEMPPVYLDSRIRKGMTVRAQDRRESEWDDHGEGYPMAQDGPNLICTLEIPQGLHILSLYDDNKDGHSGDARYRDYLVEATIGTPVEGVAERTLDVGARTRICNFWAGVYKRFLVKGPAHLSLTVDRNHSQAAMLAAIMVDPMEELAPPYFSDSDRSHESTGHRAKEISTDISLSEKIVDAMQLLQETDPISWSTKSTDAYALALRRLIRAKEIGFTDAKIDRYLSLCYYFLAKYKQSEEIETAEGRSTARSIEKSLRWNGDAACSGRGREFVLKRLAERSQNSLR